MKDGRNIIIAALLVAVLTMSIGYAAFATTLNINGNAEITGTWDVKITGIEATKTTGLFILLLFKIMAQLMQL